MSKTEKMLPQPVTRFVRSLEPTLKKSTIRSYRCALGAFHEWLDDQYLSIREIERQHTSKWLIYLSGRKIVPSYINIQIICVRRYLRWLYDEGTTKSHPDDLIRVSDMVKEPQYLPRPLPFAADKELQERLAKSDNAYHQALLLMRRTGLRIGELISLDVDCVFTDHLGNRFLKVPLGKLNTERLVPLDEGTAALVDQLRGSPDQAITKTFLFEPVGGKKARRQDFYSALAEICQGLDTGGKMVSHRLRHTYATTLLNAGMSLVSIMKLLGHNDYHMTLRYTAITQETVGKEYFEALSRLEHRYVHLLDHQSSQNDNPTKMLTDCIHLIQNLSADDASIKTISRAIIKRIQRIQADLEKLFPSTRPRL